MVGSAGMAQSFTDGEQAFLSANISGTAGQELQVISDDGEVLLAFVPAKTYANVLVSLPTMDVGSTYTIKTGSSEITAKATNVGTMGMGAMPGNPGNGNMKGQRPTDM